MVGIGWCILAWHKCQLESWGEIRVQIPPSLPLPSGTRVDLGSPLDLYEREHHRADHPSWMERNRAQLTEAWDIKQRSQPRITEMMFAPLVCTCGEVDVELDSECVCLNCGMPSKTSVKRSNLIKRSSGL